MQEENCIIEFHVLSPEKKTLLDIDCEVNGNTTVLDFLEIMYINYNIEPEKIASMFAYIPPDKNPRQLHSDQSEYTFKDLSFSNGTVLQIIYEV